MDREELITDIKLVYNLCEVPWSENEIFYLSDNKIDEKFRTWLKENEKNIYLEFVETLKETNESLINNFSIFDFFEYSFDNIEEETIEIYVDFLFDYEDLKEELEDNIMDYLELSQDEYEEDYYDEDYEDLKEDRYDDYDYYDDYN